MFVVDSDRGGSVAVGQWQWQEAAAGGRRKTPERDCYRADPKNTIILFVLSLSVINSSVQGIS